MQKNRLFSFSSLYQFFHINRGHSKWSLLYLNEENFDSLMNYDEPKTIHMSDLVQLLNYFIKPQSNSICFLTLNKIRF